MRRHFSSELQRSPYAKGRNLRWSFLFLILACLVAFFVVHCLTFPADTLTVEDAQEIFPASMEIPAPRFTENSYSYSYEDDLLFATVVLPEGASVPEDAVLTVTPIEDTENTYTAAAERVATGEIRQVKLYDVSFYTADGTYLPVSDEAKVSFHFKETVPVESRDNVAVLHFEEDGVKLPSITDVAVQEDNQLTDLSFDTEGFSVYAMVTWSEEMNLDGKSYAIVSINDGAAAEKKHAALMGYASPKNSNRLAAGLCDVMKVDSQYYVSIEDGEFTEWHFTKHGDAYYIWTGEESAPQYINIPATDSKDETLRVSGEPQDLYLEKAKEEIYPGQVRICSKSGSAVNWNGGGNFKDKPYFGAWNPKGAVDPNDCLILATPVRESMMLFDINLPQIVKSNNAITDAQKNDKDKIYMGKTGKTGHPLLLILLESVLTSCRISRMAILMSWAQPESCIRKNTAQMRKIRMQSCIVSAFGIPMILHQVGIRNIIWRILPTIRKSNSWDGFIRIPAGQNTSSIPMRPSPIGNQMTCIS